MPVGQPAFPDYLYFSSNDAHRLQPHRHAADHRHRETADVHAVALVVVLVALVTARAVNISTSQPPREPVTTAKTGSDPLGAGLTPSERL